jgi:hypothetical protein
MPANLFVSYSRRDFPFVRDFVRSLRESGMNVWLDVTNLSAGERWSSRIETALKESAYVLVVVSPYSLKSAQVQREIEAADQYQKVIVPVLLQTTVLCKRLQEIQYVDFRVSYEKALHIVLARLRNQAPSATEDWLDIPPKPSSWMGFVPLLYVACPQAVKTVSLLTAISAFFKVFVGFLSCTYLGGDGAFLGSFIILFTIFWMWWTYRAANRRVTFIEMVVLDFVVLVLPLCGLEANPPILWFFIATPFDLAIVVTILWSRSYRRWMVAYPYGLGSKN